MMAVHLHLAEDLASCESFRANPIQLTKHDEHHATSAKFPINFVFPLGLLLVSL